jgi:citrate lyase subunit beta/citryl-CoA lyase
MERSGVEQLSPIDQRLAVARSLLFVAADDQRRRRSAWASGADGVVLDLEDAIAPSGKAAARDQLAAALQDSDVRGPLRIVRVNAGDTPWGAKDLALVATLDIDAIMIPKACPRSIASLPDLPVAALALVETAIGLRGSFEVASHPAVTALALGAADLGSELGWSTRDDGAELLHARSQLVLDSAAAGIRAPFDVVRIDTRDDTGLEAETRLAADLGLRGKMCIHPAQVSAVNRLFAPDPAEVSRARRVVAALQDAERAGRGVVSIDGVMVDAPVAARARRILTLAHLLDGAAVGSNPDATTAP